jgi:hypothetical protein
MLRHNQNYQAFVHFAYSSTAKGASSYSSYPTLPYPIVPNQKRDPVRHYPLATLYNESGRV